MLAGIVCLEKPVGSFLLKVCEFLAVLRELLLDELQRVVEFAVVLLVFGQELLQGGNPPVKLEKLHCWACLMGKGLLALGIAIYIHRDC